MTMTTLVTFFKGRPRFPGSSQKPTQLTAMETTVKRWRLAGHHSPLSFENTSQLK